VYDYVIHHRVERFPICGLLFRVHAFEMLHVVNHGLFLGKRREQRGGERIVALVLVPQLVQRGLLHLFIVHDVSFRCECGVVITPKEKAATRLRGGLAAEPVVRFSDYIIAYGGF